MVVSGSGVLLRLRYVQLRRALPLYGAVLLGTAVCALPWIVSSVLVYGPNARFYMGGAVLISVLGWYQRRPDLPFVHKHVAAPRLQLAAENAALILPVVVGYGLAGAWWEGATVFASVLCVPLLPMARASVVRSRWLRAWIPAHLIEWKGAFQHTYPFGLLLWLLALAFCWLPVLPLMLVGALGIVVCSAHEQCEPRSMLLATAPNARALLRSKIMGSAKLMAILVLPVLIGATVAQPQWWWIHVLFGAGQLVLVAYAVVLKYVNYSPGDRLLGNGPLIAVAALFSVLPGLWAVPLLMLLNDRRKALHNLNFYFHGHHH